MVATSDEPALKRRQAASAADDKDRALRLQLLKLKQGGPKSGKTPEELAEIVARTKLYGAQAGNYEADNKRAQASAEATAAAAKAKADREVDLETGPTFEGNKQAAIDALGSIGIKAELSGIKTQHELDKFIDKAGLKALGGAKKGGQPAAASGDIDVLAKKLAGEEMGARDVPQKLRAAVIARAEKLRPGMDLSAYGRRVASTQHLLNDPKLVSTGQSLEHLNEAERIVRNNSLKHFDAPTLNKVLSAVKKGEGNSDFTGEALVLKIAADEVANAWGNNTVEAKHAVDVFFDPNSSQEQKLAVIGGAKTLSGGAVRARQGALDRVDPNHVGGVQIETPEIKHLLGNGTVKMKFPDGSTHDVTPDKLEKARAKGGVEVTGG